MDKRQLLSVLQGYIRKRNQMQKRRNALLKLNLMNMNNCQRSVRDMFMNRDVQQYEMEEKAIRREIWQRDYDDHFWEQEAQMLSNEDFKEHFRLSKPSFLKLCQRLSFLKRQETETRNSIPLEKKIAIALFAFGTQVKHKNVAQLFGVEKTTVGEIVLDFCFAICKSMMKEFITTYPPSQEEIADIVFGFEKLGFPQCLGVIDGIHVEISPHKNLSSEYYNSKGWSSNIFFACVDHRYKFTYVDAGTPGSKSEAYIYDKSELYEFHESQARLTDNVKVIEGIPVPLLLLGDKAYERCKFVITPYGSEDSQSRQEKIFNRRHAKCHHVAESAFNQLMARFQKIIRGLETRPENGIAVIQACCILHNFLIEEEDYIEHSWMVQLKRHLNIKGEIQPYTPVAAPGPNSEQLRRALTVYFTNDLSDEEEELDFLETDLYPMARTERYIPSSTATCTIVSPPQEESTAENNEN